MEQEQKRKDLTFWSCPLIDYAGQWTDNPEMRGTLAFIFWHLFICTDAPETFSVTNYQKTTVAQHNSAIGSTQSISMLNLMFILNTHSTQL